METIQQRQAEIDNQLIILALLINDTKTRVYCSLDRRELQDEFNSIRQERRNLKFNK